MAWEEEARKKKERVDALQKMGVEELKAELDRRTREALAHEIENLSSTVERLVNQNATKLLLASLGFAESFGRWEINRTNGNESQISAAIGNAAMQALQLAIPDFIKDYVTELSKTTFLQDAARRDFSHQLHRYTMDYVHKWIEEEAKTQSQKIIAVLKEGLDKKQ